MASDGSGGREHQVELDGEGERERKWNWRHERGTRGS
jgi:hypothetical protein